MFIKGNISKLTKYVEDGAEAVVKKSEELVETSKLNMAISSEESMIKDIYISIGKDIYKKYKDKKLADKALISMCEEIEEIEKDISSLKKKALKIKNKRLCKFCGSEVYKKDSFCPNCGRKQ